MKDKEFYVTFNYETRGAFCSGSAIEYGQHGEDAIAIVRGEIEDKGGFNFRAKAREIKCREDLPLPN